MAATSSSSACPRATPKTACFLTFLDDCFLSLFPSFSLLKLSLRFCCYCSANRNQRHSLSLRLPLLALLFRVCLCLCFRLGIFFCLRLSGWESGNAAKQETAQMNRNSIRCEPQQVHWFEYYSIINTAEPRVILIRLTPRFFCFCFSFQSLRSAPSNATLTNSFFQIMKPPLYMKN